MRFIIDVPRHFLIFDSKGVKVTINTDDPTVSNTTLLDEYKLLENIGLSKEELKTIALNSIDAAFITNEKKEELKSFLLK